ncbi:MAG: C4-dicarboxylate ABC transporter, partial [Burkholderiales bacterium]
MKTSLNDIFRRSLLATASAVMLMGALLPAAQAQNKVVLRISTPAVPDDWHAKMWTVFKDSLE